jgi:hypothetical protein
MNDIGRVEITTADPIFFDSYRLNSATWLFRPDRRREQRHCRRRDDRGETDDPAAAAKKARTPPPPPCQPG